MWAGCLRPQTGSGACLRCSAGGRRPHGCSIRGWLHGGRPRRPPPRQTRRCAAWPLTASRPPNFFFLRGKFFCLSSNILVAKKLATNQFVTNYFATKQFQRRDFNQPKPNLPPPCGLHSQMKHPPSLLSSHAPFSLTQTFPRSNAPLSISPSSPSQEAPQRMKPWPPKHSSSLLPSKP